MWWEWDDMSIGHNQAPGTWQYLAPGTWQYVPGTVGNTPRWNPSRNLPTPGTPCAVDRDGNKVLCVESKSRIWSPECSVLISCLLFWQHRNLCQTKSTMCTPAAFLLVFVYTHVHFVYTSSSCSQTAKGRQKWEYCSHSVFILFLLCFLYRTHKGPFTYYASLRRGVGGSENFSTKGL